MNYCETHSGHTIELVDLFFAHKGKEDSGLFRSLNHQFSSTCPALISGETGSGKSTLLQILAALKRPGSGECLVDGEPVSRWTSHFRDQWRKNVGILPQTPLLLGNMSVQENVALPLMNRKLEMTEIVNRSDKIINSLNLVSLKEQSASQLSGGEAQRVGLARACVVNPAFLFLDEPSAHQDDKNLGLIMEVMNEIYQRGTLILVVSHDIRLTGHPFFTDKLILKAGQMVPPQAAL
jgi:putative ABC transport system ATP-binding protein